MYTPISHGPHSHIYKQSLSEQSCSVSTIDTLNFDAKECAPTHAYTQN